MPYLSIHQHVLSTGIYRVKVAQVSENRQSVLTGTDYDGKLKFEKKARQSTNRARRAKKRSAASSVSVTPSTPTSSTSAAAKKTQIKKKKNNNNNMVSRISVGFGVAGAKRMSSRRRRH